MATELPMIWLSENDLSDFAVLAKNSTKLQDILSKSKSMAPRVGAWAMAGPLSQQVGLPPCELTQMINGLVHVYKLRCDTEVSSDDTLELIARTLRQDDKTEVLSALEGSKASIIPAMDALSEDHPLVVSHEAGSAARSRSNFIRSLEMFTDTRAVFNESRQRVLFSVITHTLSIEYDDGTGRPVQIDLSLDASDLSVLADLCEQAAAEAEALKTQKSSAPAGAPFDLEEDSK
jgi:hypothetical protein